MSKQTKREYMRSVGAALSGVGLAGFAGCTSEQNGNSDVGATTDTSDASATETIGDSETDVTSYDEELSYLIPEGQIDIPFWLSPKVMESFDARGVNVSPQVTSYGRASRALSSGSAVINHVAPAEWINIVNQGESISLIGGNLVQLNSIFTLPESDIEEPQDLEGKSLGVPYMNSGTTKMVGAMLQDGYDIDIREDVNSQSASPSVL